MATSATSPFFTGNTHAHFINSVLGGNMASGLLSAHSTPMLRLKGLQFYYPKDVSAQCYEALYGL